MCCGFGANRAHDTVQGPLAPMARSLLSLSGFLESKMDLCKVLESLWWGS